MSTILLTTTLNFLKNTLTSLNSILTGVYIKTLQDSIEMRASDMDFLAIIQIPAIINEPGEVIVSGDFISKVIKGMRSEEVEIYTKNTDQMLYIESNSSEYSLLSMNLKDYPFIERLNQTESILHIKGNILKDLMTKTSFACAKDDVKPIFKCIFFDFEDKKLKCVGTDSHRLAIKTYTLQEQPALQNLLIPNDFLSEISKNINDEMNIDFYMSSGKIAVQADNLYMQTKLIEGNFPAYQKIIPKDFNTKVTFNVQEMISAVENASRFAKDGKYINCQISAREFIIVVNNPELGKAKEIIGCKTVGMDTEITFNAEYIIQILKKFDSEEAGLFINSATAPCSIRQSNDESYNYIISPMRVINN